LLDRITPIVLTFDEAPNIGRTLERLRWAGDVVVVDSHSTDETRAIVAGFANARLFEHPFDDHTGQWTFAVAETGIRTEWAMRLSADFVVTDGLVEEMAALDPADDVAGYRIGFTYCIYGYPLRGSAYPPDVYLFRPDRTRFYSDGHGEKLAAEGRVLDLEHRILHDDRKPLERFFAAQSRYMRLESEKLEGSRAAELDLPDRIRKRRFLAPFLVFFYCLFFKGLILDGRAGWYYAFQRAAAELTLSLYLLDSDLRKRLT
jgi:glycosyltransferase involved in cell wall biosynthesis